MWIVCTLLRTFGVLLGVFLVFGGVIDATGVLRDSEVPATLAHRLVADIPIVLAGVLLLVPYAKLRGRFYSICLASLGVVSLGFAYLSAKAVYEYLLGQLHWGAIAFSLVSLGIVAGNALVVKYYRRLSTTIT